MLEISFSYFVLICVAHSLSRMDSDTFTILFVATFVPV
jgi:hypothetical protein